jgi:hypothetical protein
MVIMREATVETTDISWKTSEQSVCLASGPSTESHLGFKKSFKTMVYIPLRGLNAIA